MEHISATQMSHGYINVLDTDSIVLRNHARDKDLIHLIDDLGVELSSRSKLCDRHTSHSDIGDLTPRAKITKRILAMSTRTKMIRESSKGMLPQVSALHTLTRAPLFA